METLEFTVDIRWADPDDPTFTRWGLVIVRAKSLSGAKYCAERVIGGRAKEAWVTQPDDRMEAMRTLTASEADENKIWERLKKPH